ncbi:hypothetical protein EK21DRAFT_119716 [Setomelanomma holmii]|uniref:NACHT domain-containing protein n=1 Tax=Setomelanomma holmii TaxID=210430 RepID=A0A9P4GUY0_9PLEO|nr:hypothetical protein EK21DRAFT_119716 [Setomelanomma holmii]
MTSAKIRRNTLTVSRPANECPLCREPLTHLLLEPQEPPTTTRKKSSRVSFAMDKIGDDEDVTSVTHPWAADDSLATQQPASLSMSNREPGKDNNNKQVAQHVAQHLKSLAFVSLEWWGDECFSTDSEASSRRSSNASETNEKAAFLSWVSSIDFEKAHQDIYAKKHEQTCHWLITEPEYQQWFSSPVSSLLWCYGKPGIGKSVLASNVVEDIKAQNGLQEDAAICFAYYNYRDTRLGEISQIVAALMKQLCRKKERIPHNLLQVKHDALPPSLIGTRERFVSLIEDLSRVYVVFDALDECPEQERKDILSFITSIVTVPGPCSVKVFVTSRKRMDIAKAFEDRSIPTIPIRADNVAADIEAFARSQVEKLRTGEHGKTLYVTSDDLRHKIVQALAAKADGMFLWVNLQLDSLCQASKAQKDQVVEDALETLPQGLPDTYVRILERIEDQSPYMRCQHLRLLRSSAFHY